MVRTPKEESEKLHKDTQVGTGAAEGDDKTAFERAMERARQPHKPGERIQQDGDPSLPPR